MTSPTQRSVAALRAEGWHVEVVERWNAHARVRQDLLGCADLLALRPGAPPLLVQVTTGDHVAARLAKCHGEPRLRLWLQAGGAFAVHGWRLAGPAGARKRWALRAVPVTLADLPNPEETHP